MTLAEQDRVSGLAGNVTQQLLNEARYNARAAQISFAESTGYNALHQTYGTEAERRQHAV
jgi:hypothetical protein